LTTSSIENKKKICDFALTSAGLPFACRYGFLLYFSVIWLVLDPYYLPKIEKEGLWSLTALFILGEPALLEFFPTMCNILRSLLPNLQRQVHVPTYVKQEPTGSCFCRLVLKSVCQVACAL